MNRTILLVDDEEKLRNLLKRLLQLEGFEVLTAESLAAAHRMLDKHPVPVVLCDVKLPDGSGLDFVRQAKERHPVVEIILLTAYGNIPDGVQAMRNGAFDYILKGDDNDRIIPLLYRALEKNELQQRVAQLEQQVGKLYSFDTIMGKSRVLEQAKAQARKVAPTDATVLLLGETGTGKELFAQAIHTESKRGNKPFVALNCSAFSRDLLESELFGHKAGAFTGAVKDKKGLIEEANTGTLFLDEIGELHPELQAKLLRVLETGEFIKVGDTKPTKVQVRIIAATNRNLEEEVAQGHFREDLFYRLNVFSVSLPPLRERKEDIRVLAAYFIPFFAHKTNKQIRDISPAFLDHLEAHKWKGNVRELKNVIERAVILSEGAALNTYNLPPELQSNTPSGENNFSLATAEKCHIVKMLHYTGGNKAQAARLLDIGLATLYRKMEEYGLKKE
jgi:DNA-binding NtrC family response regulator